MLIWDKKGYFFGLQITNEIDFFHLSIVLPYLLPTTCDEHKCVTTHVYWGGIVELVTPVESEVKNN